jgi:hypothetical protein
MKLTLISYIPQQPLFTTLCATFNVASPSIVPHNPESRVNLSTREHSHMQTSKIYGIQNNFCTHIELSMLLDRERSSLLISINIIKMLQPQHFYSHANTFASHSVSSYTVTPATMNHQSIVRSLSDPHTPVEDHKSSMVFYISMPPAQQYHMELFSTGIYSFKQ